MLFVLLITCGCNNNSKNISDISEETTNEIELKDVPNGLIKNYENADFDKYNSLASVNGLKNTKIYVIGKAESIFNTNSSIECILCDENNHKWLIIMDSKQKSNIEDYKYLENDKVCVVGVYDGYSKIREMPALTMNKIFDMQNGDLLSSRMFNLYDGNSKSNNDVKLENINSNTTETIVFETETTEDPYVKEKIKENRERILREDWVENKFDPLFGTCRIANEFIKKNLNDESSFKCIETRYADLDSDDKIPTTRRDLKSAGCEVSNVKKWDLVVEVQYSAKNAYNATVKNYAIVLIKYKTDEVYLLGNFAYPVFK